MAKKPGSNNKGEWAFFDVVYEDGSQRSNRRVPADLLGGLEKDEPARGYIIEQDREIAEKSGRAPLAIKSLARTGRRLRTLFADPFEVLNRYYFDTPWLEHKMKIECRD